MKRIILFIAIFILAINISRAQSNKSFTDKFELSKDILDAVKNRNTEKIKVIANSLTLPYSLFQKQLQTNNNSSASEILPSSWYAKDSNIYNNYASNFYFENFIQSLLNDTDNDITFGDKIYVVLNKKENKKDKITSQNYIDILFDNKSQIKAIRIFISTTESNQIYTFQQATFTSYNKSNLSTDILNRPSKNFEIYTLENNNFKFYDKDYIHFDDSKLKLETTKTEEKITEINQENTSNKDSEIFESVEVMPEYSGGTKKLLLYLKDNLHYPKAAQKNKIEGIVVVRFIVDINGSIKNPVIIKDATNGFCTEEALRLVKNMPKWWPGKQGGKAVKVYYTLAIPFSLK